MKRNISRVLLEATQTKLAEWAEKIKGAEVKGQELKFYEEKKQELATKLKEAHEKRVSIRELSKITGISNTTIGRWIKELKANEQPQHASS